MSGLPNLSYSGTALGGVATNRSVNIVGAGGGTVTDFARIMNILGDASETNGGFSTTRDTTISDTIARVESSSIPLLPILIVGGLVTLYMWKRG